MNRYILVVLLLLSTTVRGQNSAQEYIGKHINEAMFVMQEYGIPVSVVLAVAMHESANGNSRVAQKLNNHFGMKGRFYNREFKSHFIPFSTVQEGYTHFAEIIRNRSKLIPLFDRKEKRAHIWIKEIQKTGYAASRRWKKQILSIIERYNLTQFDFVEEDKEGNLSTQMLNEERSTRSSY